MTGLDAAQPGGVHGLTPVHTLLLRSLLVHAALFVVAYTTAYAVFYVFYKREVRPDRPRARRPVHARRCKRAARAPRALQPQ